MAEMSLAARRLSRCAVVKDDGRGVDADDLLAFVSCDAGTGFVVPETTIERVCKRRETLRAAGLRPVRIRVPGTRRPGFAEEWRRQARLTAAADAADREVMELLDQPLADLDGDERG